MKARIAPTASRMENKLRNCRTYRLNMLSFPISSRTFGPHSLNLRAASCSLSPFSFTSNLYRNSRREIRCSSPHGEHTRFLPSADSFSIEPLIVQCDTRIRNLTLRIHTIPEKTIIRDTVKSYNPLRSKNLEMEAPL